MLARLRNGLESGNPLKATRPTDWVIAAGAAAFIAAGAIALWPSNADDAPAETAALSDGDGIFGSRFDWQPQDDGGMDLIAAVRGRTADEPETVRKVATETIRIEPMEMPPEVQTASLALSAFTLGDRRISGGCGLLLTRVDDQNAILFFHELAGAEEGSRGYVLIDDRMVSLERTDRSGDPLGFGQYPLQVFDSEDGEYHVLVDVDLGAGNDGALRLPVTKGQIVVTGPEGRTATVPVSGDAGC